MISNKDLTTHACAIHHGLVRGAPYDSLNKTCRCANHYSGDADDGGDDDDDGDDDVDVRCVCGPDVGPAIVW